VLDLRSQLADEAAPKILLDRQAELLLLGGELVDNFLGMRRPQLGLDLWTQLLIALDSGLASHLGAYCGRGRFLCRESLRSDETFLFHRIEHLRGSAGRAPASDHAKPRQRRCQRQRAERCAPADRWAPAGHRILGILAEGEVPKPAEATGERYHGRHHHRHGRLPDTCDFSSASSTTHASPLYVLFRESNVKPCSLRHLVFYPSGI
jgi:hypothetical protein